MIVVRAGTVICNAVLVPMLSHAPTCLRAADSVA